MRVTGFLVLNSLVRRHPESSDRRVGGDPFVELNTTLNVDPRLRGDDEALLII